jgi:tight adherence protein B
VLISLLVFLVVTAAVAGGYFAVTYLPAMLAGRRIGERLKEVGQLGLPDDTSETATVVKQTADGPLPAIDRLMDRAGVGRRVRSLIDQAGVKTTPAIIMVLSLVLGGLFGMMASVFVRVALLSMGLALIGAALPMLYLLQRRAARIRRFEEQFPEALDLLSRALRAGHALQTALGMVGEELPDPVGPEFKKTFEQQNFGLPLSDALNELAQRTGLLDVQFFVTAVAIQRETGGNLAEILDNLANVVRDRFKLLRQVRVHTAHGRFTGYILLALPAALGVALSFISAEHMNTLFTHPVGQMMLVGAAVMQTVGYFWIRQVIKIEV